MNEKRSKNEPSPDGSTPTSKEYATKSKTSTQISETGAPFFSSSKSSPAKNYKNRPAGACESTA